MLHEFESEGLRWIGPTFLFRCWMLHEIEHQYMKMGYFFFFLFLPFYVFFSCYLFVVSSPTNQISFLSYFHACYIYTHLLSPTYTSFLHIFLLFSFLLFRCCKVVNGLFCSVSFTVPRVALSVSLVLQLYGSRPLPWM